MAREDLIVQIGASLAPLRRSLDQAAKDMKRFSFRAESIGRDLTARVSIPIAAMGVASVKTYAAFDRMEKGLAALNGSVAAGKAQFDRLNKVVLDTRTTLDLRTAALGAQRLQGAGLSAQFAEEAIKQLGIAATVSGSAVDDVGGVLRQFTQIIGKGKIEQEDLNTILDRMPALGAVIKKEFGVSTAEGIRETGLSMQQFVARLILAIQKNEDFQNVQGGLAKAFESFSNAVQTGIRPLGESIAKAINLEEVLGKLSAKITAVAEGFANLSPRTQKFIVYTAGAAAATGPLVFGLGAAARAVVSFRSAFALLSGPVGKVAKLLGSAAVQFSGFASLLIRGGAIGRSIALAKALGGIRVALAAITGPVGITIAAITGLVGGFKAAYSGSSFFRDQLSRVTGALAPVRDGLSNLASKILPNLGEKFKSLKGVTDTVFAGIGAIISVAIESVLLFIEQVKLGIGIAQDLARLDFSAAGEKLGQTLLNPQVAAQAAVRFATAFTTTFDEILNQKPPKVPVDIDTGGLPATGSSEIIVPEGPGRKIAQAVAPLETAGKSGLGLSLIILQLQQVGRQAENLDAVTQKMRKMADDTEIVKVTTAFQQLQESLDIVDTKSTVFGTGFDAMTEKIALTRQALTELLDEGLPEYDNQVELIQERLAGFIAQQEEATAAIRRTQEVMSLLGEVSNSAFDSVARAMKEGATAVQAFGRAVVAAVRDAIAAEIKLAVATQVKKALASFPFPLNVALAAGAGAGAAALFTSAINAINIPALAKGGYVDQPTLALIGEAGPEVVVPLDRMEQFRGQASPGAIEVFGQFEARGDRLIAVIERSRPAYNRTY